MSAGFALIARRFDMQWSLNAADVRPRVLVAVSPLGHRLYDLMHRWRSGSLPVDIIAVVANHEDMRSFVEWSGLPSHLPPVAKEAKLEPEARFLALLEELQIEEVVLAGYMQILSPERR